MADKVVEGCLTANDVEPRFGSQAAAVDGKLYTYRGFLQSYQGEDTVPYPTHCEVFDGAALQWRDVATRESCTSPSAMRGIAITTIGSKLYMYGGFGGGTFSDELYELDTVSMKLSKLTPQNPSSGPIKKSYSGLISLRGEVLCCFGGYGIPRVGLPQDGSEFTPKALSKGGVGWCNELHCYCLKEATWSSPQTSGQAPPPCADMTFTRVDMTRVITIGGFQPGREGAVNEVHILDTDNWHWSGAILPQGPWLQPRAYHSAHSLWDPDSNPEDPCLVVACGVACDGRVLDDVWILSVNSLTSVQVSLPSPLTPRTRHVGGVIHVSDTRKLLVISGGVSENPREYGFNPDHYPLISDTKVIELEFDRSQMRGNCLGWTAVSVKDSSVFKKRITMDDTKSSEQLLKQAMEDGYVLCRITLCLLIGVAGSGKTHVKHLLLRLLPPELRQSTPLFELPTRAIPTHDVSLSRATFARSSPRSLWNVASFEDLDRILISSIKAKTSVGSADVAAASLQQEVRTNRMDVCPPMVSDLESGGSASITDIATTTSTASSSAHNVTTTSQPTMSSSVHNLAATFQPPESFDDLDLPLSDLERELIDLVSMSSGSEQLFEVDWVYLLDSGGQPEFRHLLPAFIKRASAILTVTKLNEGLDHRPTVEYYDDSGQSCGSAYVSTLSNEEILMQNVRIMESRYSGFLDKRGPSVFVIGTHKDLESSSGQAEDRSSKNQRLVSLLRPIFGRKLGFYSLPEEELIFPVNAKQPGPDDQDVAEKLREMVMKLSKEKPVKIPVSWWVLDQFLRKLASKKGLKILSLRECEMIGRKLHMSPEACHAALVFLSDLNILFYDPKLLPGIVFLTSQVLVGMVTLLVHHAHVLREKKAQHKVGGGGDWLYFRDYGLLTVQLLSTEVFDDCYRSEVFSSLDFLHLLKALNLVARLNDEEYMMPCLLPDLPLANAEEYCRHCPTSPASTLLVHYPERLLPAGVFPIAVAYLRNEAAWKLALQKGTCKPELFCCNCAKFNLPSGRRGTVTLLDSIKYLEIHIHSVNPKACHVACQEIVRDVFRALKEAAKILEYGDLQPEKAFFCPQRGPKCEESLHTATINICDHEWVCSVNAEVGGQLTKQQSVWLCESHTTSDSMLVDGSYQECGVLPNTVPHVRLSEGELAAVGKYLRSLSKAEVTKLGIQMGLSYKWLKDVKSSGTYRYDLVDAWLKEQNSVAEVCPPTWQNFVATLREVNQDDIADRVTKEKGFLAREQSTTTSSLSHSLPTAGIAENPMSEGDLPAVGKYLCSLSKAEVTELGIQMGLRYRWLKDHESSETYQYDVVYAWLERQDWVAEMCPPTWQNIVTTLRELDHYGVAEKMSKGRVGHSRKRPRPADTSKEVPTKRTSKQHATRWTA